MPWPLQPGLCIPSSEVAVGASGSEMSHLGLSQRSPQGRKGPRHSLQPDILAPTTGELVNDLLTLAGEA